MIKKVEDAEWNQLRQKISKKKIEQQKKEKRLKKKWKENSNMKKDVIKKIKLEWYF